MIEDRDRREHQEKVKTQTIIGKEMSEVAEDS